MSRINDITSPISLVKIALTEIRSYGGRNQVLASGKTLQELPQGLKKAYDVAFQAEQDDDVVSRERDHLIGRKNSADYLDRLKALRPRKYKGVTHLSSPSHEWNMERHSHATRITVAIRWQFDPTDISCRVSHLDGNNFEEVTEKIQRDLQKMGLQDKLVSWKICFSRESVSSLEFLPEFDSETEAWFAKKYDETTDAVSKYYGSNKYNGD